MKQKLKNWKENWDNSNRSLYYEIKEKCDRLVNKYVTKEVIKQITTLGTIVWLFLKLFIYSYRAGIFSVYNISPKYNTVNDSIQQAIILDVCFVIVMLFFTWLNIYLSVKNKIMKTCLLFAEWIGIMIFCTFPHCISFFST